MGREEYATECRHTSVGGVRKYTERTHGLTKAVFALCQHCPIPAINTLVSISSFAQFVNHGMEAGDLLLTPGNI